MGSRGVVRKNAGGRHFFYVGKEGNNWMFYLRTDLSFCNIYVPKKRKMYEKPAVCYEKVAQSKKKQYFCTQNSTKGIDIGINKQFKV